MLFKQRYVCAASSRFEVLREVQMPRGSRAHSIRQIGRLDVALARRRKE